MSPPMMIAMSVAAFFMALAYAGALLWNDYKTTKSFDKRLDRLSGVKTPSLEESGLIKEGGLYPADTKNFIEEMLPALPSLNKLFEQANLKMKMPQFLGISAGAAVGVGLVMVLLNMATIAPIGAIIGAGIPLVFVMQMRKRRFKKFEAQLSEALELVARALRAGHSLASGMHVVAEEMPEPISSEFGRVYEEQNLGIALEDAMRNLAARIPNLDLKFFVTAVIIQRQTGGDLAEILDKIGYIIRERFKLLGMVQALTGEGRISGVVLIALPILLVFVMMGIAPDYIDDLWTEELGRKMSIFGIVMMIIGAICIRKIVNIKV